MPIAISRELERKLPAAEQPGIAKFLESKAGGICSLCDGKFNLAADVVEPDHILAEREGGKTERANLSLAHKTCNAFKRNAPSVDVRPFLKLRRYLAELNLPGGHLAHYGDCLPYFALTPKPSSIQAKDGRVAFEYGDGSRTEGPLLQEQNRDRTYLFTFVAVPPCALFNDEECQPRTIKPEHLWKLYSDIQRNPLHEPPSVRVGSPDNNGLVNLLMFDGQHKTIAMWLSDRPNLVAKVYLDLTKDETVRLVNSIQARIPKLPLSTFELSAKMDDENSARLNAYLANAGMAATERGFIDSTEPAVRDRVRAAFKLALANSIIENSDLAFIANVARAGEKSSAKLTENVFKTKVVDLLLELKPLEEPWADSDMLRSHEQENIVRALNRLHELAFAEPSGGFTDHQKERRRRLMYQAALTHVAGLIRSTFRHILATDVGREFLDKEPDVAQWNKIDAALKRLVEHPVWTADFQLSAKMRAVETALTKNQDIEAAFRAVGLTTGYVVGADMLPSNWAD